MSNIEDTNTSMVSNVREEKYNFLRSLPENRTLHKCGKCHYVFDISHGGQLNILTILRTRSYVYCPNCLERDSELICKVDAYSIFLKLKGKKCRTGEIIAGADICPVCNRSLCPQCMNHNVIALSRVTGYMSDIGGWNHAKRQELLDRQRYVI